jgi:Cu-processing system permease protein
MISIYVLAYQSFLQLVRDRIFIPVIVASFGLFAFSAIASEWGIEDFRKMLFDFGFMGLSLLGTFVAIFWGVKMVCDDKEGGSIDLVLIAPVARWQIVVARFLGLGAALIIMAVVLLGAWQLVMWWNRFGLMRDTDLIAYAGIVMSWLSMASVALTMATMSGYTIALFSSVCLWVLFRSSEAVFFAMPQNTDPMVKEIVQFFSTYFNFQYFDFLSWTYEYTAVSFSWAEVAMRMSYGVCFIVGFLMVGVLSFARKDF